MKTASKQSLWYVSVFESDYKKIEQLKNEIALIFEYQNARLRELVTTTELAHVAKCGKPHASDVRSGNRQLSQAKRKLLIEYLKQKHHD
jgi:hypothetical protein